MADRMTYRGTLKAVGATDAWDHSGGCGWFAVVGEFGHGLLSLEYSPDGGKSWIETQHRFGYGYITKFELPPGKLRASLSQARFSGETNPSVDIYTA